MKQKGRFIAMWVLLGLLLPVLPTVFALGGSKPKKRVLMLPKAVWEQPVALDSKTREPVSLREAAACIKRKRGWPGLPDLSSRNVRWLSDLEGDELNELIITRLLREPDMSIGVMGNGIFSSEQLIREVQEGSPVGQLFIKMEKLQISDLLHRVKAGECEFKD